MASKHWDMQSWEDSRDDERESNYNFNSSKQIQAPFINWAGYSLPELKLILNQLNIVIAQKQNNPV